MKPLVVYKMCDYEGKYQVSDGGLGCWVFDTLKDAKMFIKNISNNIYPPITVPIPKRKRKRK